MTLHERSVDSWADHALILQSIVKGDSETAARLMDLHVAKDEQVYRDKFEAR